MIRFSPEGMKRLKDYESDIKRRIRNEELTNEEGYALLQARVRAEASGTNPRKVRCPDCGAIHPIVGKGPTFKCCTEKVRSVWDCRIQ